jgi:small-conductance mechanosensitive channel
MEALGRIENLVYAPLLQFQDVSLSLMLLLQTVTILLVAAILSRLFIRFLRRTLFTRARLTLGIQESIARVLHYIIIVLALFIALEHLGIDLTALAAVGAILMVGIGFGLQNIASNFISGLILLFERPIQVGDFVEVKGVLGTVRAINARSTTVETQDNVSIIVPNSHFIAESVTNWSYRDSRTRIHVRVGVSYEADVDQVEKILIEVAAAQPEVVADPPPTVQFYEFGDSALNFDLLVWIDDPRRQFFIGSDLNFSIVRAFRANDIQIPFPQRDLHLVSAVPLQVRAETTSDKE